MLRSLLLIGGEHRALSEAKKALRRAFGSIFLFSLATNLLVLAVPLYMMQIYDRVLASKNPDTLLMLTVIALAALMTMAGLEAVRILIAARTGLWLERKLSPPILSAIVNVTRSTNERRSAQALRDLTTFRKFFGGRVVFCLFDFPWSPIFVGVIYLIHPLMGHFSLAGAITLLIIALLNELLTRKTTRQSNSVSTKSMNDADALVQNADSIMANGMRSNLINLWARRREPGLKSESAGAERSAWLLSFAKLLRAALQVGILGLGAWLAIQGEISPGFMIAGSILMGRALAPIEQIIGAWTHFLNATMAYARIRQILNKPGLEGISTELPEPAGWLTAETVTWAPEGVKAPIIKGVSLDLLPGESLGIVGPSAAGKSTLAKLLCGIYVPNYGSIRLDSAELCNWESDERGKYIGFLPQDIELFNTTVKENIARFDPEAADARVIDAAILAGAHELILRLPDGYETVIGPGGIPISGGQRQRIGLARALFGDPKLVVLDEPNAYLDQSGEQALLKVLAKLREKGVTVVMVAQRPAGLSEMTKLLVMRDGSAEIFGEREKVIELLTKGRENTPQPRTWQLASGGE